MAAYWFAYSTATGAIPTGYAILSNATSNPWPGLGSEFTTVSFDEQTASADVVMANAHPERYLMQGSPVAPVLQPYLTAAYASGVLTVTVNNPPATPPTSATLTVDSTTETITLASNTGTLALAVHASLAGYSLPAQVTATGCVGTSVDVGTPGQSAPTVAIQVAIPAGETTPTVSPCGPNSIAFLQQYYAPDIYEAVAGLNMLAPGAGVRAQSTPPGCSTRHSPRAALASPGPSQRYLLRALRLRL